MKPVTRILIALVLLARTGSGQQPSAPLPSSTLPLRLVGALKDTVVPARSAGLIECGSAQEKRPATLFAVGERACDVAELREVLEDAVVIRNLLTGRLELIRLPPAGPRAALPPAAASEAQAETGREAPVKPLVMPASAGVVRVELRKEMLDRLLSNLPEVLGSALATPRYAAGGSGPPVIEGYTVSRIKAGGIVEQLGLQDGDVLLEFNGQRLDSLGAVTGLLGQARALEGAKMTVLRGDRTVTFVFSVT